MSTFYCEAEDQIIRDGVRAGTSDRGIQQALAEAGHDRTLQSVQSRRLKLGIRREHDHRNAAVLAIEAPVVDHRDGDAKFCAAMRAAHPDLPHGLRSTESSRSVPLRSLPRPVFSSTGVMS